MTAVAQISESLVPLYSKFEPSEQQPETESIASSETQPSSSSSEPGSPASEPAEVLSPTTPDQLEESRPSAAQTTGSRPSTPGPTSGHCLETEQRTARSLFDEGDASPSEPASTSAERREADAAERRPGGAGLDALEVGRCGPGDAHCRAASSGPPPAGSGLTPEEDAQLDRLLRAKKFTPEELNEPILRDNPNRFTLFPIHYGDLWEFHKQAVASFWTVEEVDFQGDLRDWDRLKRGPQMTPHRRRPIRIVDEAVLLEDEFCTEALSCELLGMNAVLMRQYIRFVADRLLHSLGYDKHYGSRNPFDWMEMISLQGKANFFERRVGEYQRAGVMGGNVTAQDPSEYVFSLDCDF
ncbi:Ribonucleoside-diphosphate reductase small chain [Tetrabaena socialis]|uniref:Ribonucleoside-diphosphate reductase small chain n=1 Tax=Tetrabaena socialis TaxID=47790 RepID=A0A2J8A628_9CHLO|nr:Ribonucleoside-diphosphate reductase small chain [Tetrabaena socialis]|eukprot:PNH07953.1 Ribonucleoside-diphosphate reductase small chain [Tetrabaena socialis]